MRWPWQTKSLPPPPVSDLVLSDDLTDAVGHGLDWTDSGVVRGFDNHFESYTNIYRRQPAVRAVVDFLAKNIAQIGIKVYRKEGDTSVYLPDHPAQKLLNRPAPRLPRSRFFRQIISDIAIYDRACILKVRQEDRIALVRVPPPDVEVMEQSFVDPVRFSIVSGRDRITPSIDDVIWLHGYSPTSNVSGVSPMETLRQILAEESAAGHDRERAWRNGNRADGFYERSVESVDVVDSASVKRWEADMKTRTGGPRGAHGSPLLPPGYHYEKASFNAADSEYIATRKLARDEVARAYGIPLAVLGLRDTSDWGTDQYHQMLYQDCLAPWLVWIQEELEQQLLYSDFELEGEESGVFLEFNINEKMRGSFLDQAKIGQQAVGGPWMTRNEFRERFQNLPPIPGGDEIVIPSNVILGGGPQANPADAANQFSDGLRAVD